MTELRKKVFRHLLIQTTGRVIFVLLSLLIVSLMMRYLGPEKYGFYSIAIAFLQVFGIVADFGLYTVTLQYLGISDSFKDKRKVDDLMSNLFTMRFFLALIFYGLAASIGLFFPYPLMVKIGILILSASLFFSTLIQHLSSLYQKMFATEEIFKAEVLGRIVLLCLILIFVFFNLGFYFILLTFVIANFINFLLLYSLSARFIKLRFAFDFSFWQEVFAKVWPVGLAIALNVVYFKADTLILSFYAPASAVGFYGAAYRIFECLITFPIVFLSLVLPLLATTFISSKEKFGEIFQKSFDFLVMIALPFVFGSLALGPGILEFFGGQDFRVAGEILKVIALAAGILFVGELFKQLMIVLNQQKKVLPFYFLTTIVSLIGYFILIPLYSYWGAAWMTVGVESLMFVFLLTYFKKQTGILPKMNFFLKSLFSSCLMFLFLIFFNKINILALVGLGILIYFFLLFLLKGISKEEIKEMIGQNVK